jgi:hypothetical protein
MSQPTASEVLRRLQGHPSLANLEFKKVIRFLDLVQRLWLEIVPPQSSRPAALPSTIVQFLSAVLNLKEELVKLCWIAFGDLGDTYFCDTLGSVDDDFRVHGHKHNLGPSDLISYPTAFLCVLTLNRSKYSWPSLVILL